MSELHCRQSKGRGTYPLGCKTERVFGSKEALSDSTLGCTHMLSGSCTLAWASSSEVMDATLGWTKEGEGPGCQKQECCYSHRSVRGALGSDELMRTGWEISILCLLLSWAALWLTDSAENECLFLAFFFPSLLRWADPFPLDGDALGEGPGEQGPSGAGSELGPGAFVGAGLSISINCLAVSFN
ncbi:hypothetical protein EYF80_036995 [Liparis tanakae]|uniref:Uncharacterized protein n=1 Tax=Liparis tanakae TaxID=230148 RepID=A0A4Z2GI34_9TELE|nr:hypothetical protein EYF80_036995 [Liparis tanakae]